MGKEYNITISEVSNGFVAKIDNRNYIAYELDNLAKHISALLEDAHNAKLTDVKLNINYKYED